MVTWIPSIYPSHVSIYIPYMDPMGYGIIRPPEFCTHVLPPNFNPKFGGVYQASLASYRAGRFVYLAILPGSCWEKGNAEATLKGRVEAKNHADVIRMYLQMVRLPSYYVTICMATIHPLLALYFPPSYHVIVRSAIQSCHGGFLKSSQTMTLTE